ncbi:MAG: efflux RND transporter permease subunit [Lachnospiraceae bacterium]|nr:efflux RND transporter permease subunit [Lachnospiraceae bacterium]
MEKFGRVIVKLRYVILIAAVILLIPSGIGYLNTRVNYDILYYLPGEIETMVGQDILLKDFGKGAYAEILVQGLNPKEEKKLEDKLADIPNVQQIVSYESFAGNEIPIELLPEKYSKLFYNPESDTTLLAVFFSGTTSSDETMNAIQEIRNVLDDKGYISGMSAVVTDTKNLSEKETPIYVLIAVVLVCIVLAIFMDSFLVPVFFMLSIGMAIIYNLGSNIFFGEISYITQALAAVLQLGVTLDYSIFLWHSFKEEKEKYPDDHKEAMAHAIGNTLTSVVGSSITTIAGFIALCFMSFTLGKDLGLVMAKGVVMGVIGCVTILPSMIMIFDKSLEKTMHKEILPRFDKPAAWVTKHFYIFLIIFAVLLGPAIYGYKNTQVYYDLAATLPDDLDCSIGNKMLSDNFDMNSLYMILSDSSLDSKTANKMMEEISDLDGITFALSLDSALGNEVPEDILPQKIIDDLKGNDYQIMLVASDYGVASDDINTQIDAVNEISKRYDSTSMVIGEAPCTKDLITITDKDFKTVSIVSIAAIFIIILCVVKSISLPVILVATIEFAIFVNMGLPFYTGKAIPFISSVVIGTIQLGATVDYAILMTTRYKKERHDGMEKKEAITKALAASIPSIIVSAVGFFAATFGVGLVASVDMIGSLCTLMARGAIISMFIVILVLPSLFMMFDPLIVRSSIGFREKKGGK